MCLAHGLLRILYLSIRIVDMNAFANSCAVSLPHEGVRGKGSVRQTSAKPQQCFADAAALVGSKEQIKTDKSVIDMAATDTKAVCKQGTLDSRKRSSRSTPDNDQVVVAAALSDQPTHVPVWTGKDGTRLDSASALFRRVPSKELSRAGTLPGKAADGVVDAVAGDQSSSPHVVHGRTAGAPHASQEGPADVEVHAAGGAPVSHQGKAEEVKASSPVPAETGHPSPQKPQEGNGQETASITQSEPPNVDKKEPAVVAMQPAEKGEPPRAQRSVAAVTASSGAPSVTRSLQKDDLPAVPELDQATPKAPFTRQNRTVELPQRPEQSIPRPHTEGRRHTTPRHEDTPIREHRQMEIMGAEGKKIESAQHVEGANSQVKPPASAISQPAAVASHPLFETPTRGIADVGTASSPVRAVSEQILDSVRASGAQGDRQITVRLQPPELGTITVRLREQSGHLEGVVEVGKSDTRREIERALPEVVRGLQDIGIPIRKFDVTAGDSPGQDLGRGLPQQDAWSGQNGSGQNRDHLAASHTPWSQEAANYPVRSSEETATAGGQSSAPPGRIDMLL
jgi:flagellar hook-length control protein FliK